MTRQRKDARPTVRDVAEVAGVSFKTVARAINGEPGVRPETADRVMAAARQLGFQRNVIAASFKRGVSQDTIGLVIDDVANPFFATLARAIDDATRARDVQVIVSSSDRDPVRERAVIDRLVAQRIGGLIIVPIGRDHRYLAREMRRGTSVVFLDRPQGHLRADTVTVNDYGGARTAVEHLLAHGHRRIAWLSHPPDIFTLRERRRGYEEALAAAGVELDPDLVRMEALDADDAMEAALDLLSGPTPPTAIFGANNRMTVGAIRAISRQRRSIALVGFDDFELADALGSPVTVVRPDVRELGRVAAQLLLERMDGSTVPPRRIVLPVELVQRGSAEAGPADPG
jgi:LacI family transcriptional regulator